MLRHAAYAAAANVGYAASLRYATLIASHTSMLAMLRFAAMLMIYIRDDTSLIYDMICALMLFRHTRSAFRYFSFFDFADATPLFRPLLSIFCSIYAAAATLLLHNIVTTL